MGGVTHRVAMPDCDPCVICVEISAVVCVKDCPEGMNQSSSYVDTGVTKKGIAGIAFLVKAIGAFTQLRIGIFPSYSGNRQPDLPVIRY